MIMRTMKVDVALTGRECLFLQNICMGLRPAAAATAAGYSIASGVHLIRKPAIDAAIREIHANLCYIVRQMDKRVEKHNVASDAPEYADA